MTHRVGAGRTLSDVLEVGTPRIRRTNDALRCALEAVAESSAAVA